ncbi:MAG: segregation/condensation protein A [Oscillospiraceae bacterium]|nr:segregation/condensation protein A [Oscillospiraceae bacterium]
MNDPRFRLEGIVHEKDELTDFEGPLSLILMLLEKNKIQIRELKISEILDQYLAWMDEMQRMDLEIASEFVQMAAHLLYIKTRTLLTAEEEVSELETLMQSLEQLKAKDSLGAVRELLPALKKASERGLLYMEKPPEPLPRAGKTYEYRHENVDLLRALYAVFSRGIKVPEEDDAIVRAIPRRPLYSVRSKSRELLERLRVGPVLLGELYRTCTSRSELVATFLSVLELCSMGSVRIDREGEDHRLSFTGGETEQILEKIEE